MAYQRIARGVTHTTMMNTSTTLLHTLCIRAQPTSAISLAPRLKNDPSALPEPFTCTMEQATLITPASANSFRSRPVGVLMMNKATMFAPSPVVRGFVCWPIDSSSTTSKSDFRSFDQLGWFMDTEAVGAQEVAYECGGWR
ncbi:predicted protein [Histoplasma capsulatum G186AR]|uniref:Uncharacterized protein n=1 Tax=Ajellomyces capsulatus (strain G186AR / H82 / ATCC MYA-2454 / RMSCC 2432) TaxID=447093 RepID=C0NY47_AJECG|nr:uncharacterized protein HCBG_07841 [Histoplasma capsulatum G186AR]EEH03715.1 predicted protein [Histoplasma capsulatum G186AR]